MAIVGVNDGFSLFIVVEGKRTSQKEANYGKQSKSTVCRNQQL